MTVDEAFSLIDRAVETGRAAHGYLVCGDLRGSCDVLADRVLRRLFPEARRMRNYNAFVQKHPWALPAAYVERIVKCAPPLWKQTLNELRLLRKAGKE